MARLHRFAWFGSLVVALSGCGDDADSGPGPSASPDAGADVVNEASPDASEDVAADVSPDTALDSPAEAGPVCSPAPRGGRMLGLDLLDVPASSNFGVNLDKARELDIDFIALHVTWPSIEPSPQTYEDPGGALAALAGVAQTEGWKFSLTIRPIDLTGKTVPSDLDGTRFSEPVMTERFNAMVDFVLTVVPPELLTSLQVGNEIDGFDASGEHPDFWSDYGAFLYGVTSHVHASYPEVRVGFTGTFHGLTGGSLHDLGVWTAFASVVDVVGVTYYPTTDSFQVRPADDVHGDFDEIVAAFPGKPILLQEVGYQTAEACGSTDALQAEFFAHVFCAWDQHAGQIETMNIVRLNDVTRTDAEVMAGPYGLGDEPFIEYLRTLGLRLNEGVDKPAFGVVRDSVAAREW